MKTSIINIKTDPKLKREAQKVARELGVPLSVPINAYLQQFIATKEVHLYTPQKLSARYEKKLKKWEDDIKRGRNLSPAFTNMKDAIKYLKKQRA
ncbi:MAG TPA: hypothetical protein VI981_04005 [Candidatus Paceibacterota bacterium]